LSGQPGAGCDDPRDAHEHSCGFCGAVLAFAAIQCATLVIVPRCPRCGSQNWRGDIDELTGPHYRE
jgi:hypothetical protein